MEFLFTVEKKYSVNIVITSSASPTKWSNTLKQFASNSWRIVSVFFTISWGWPLQGYYPLSKKCPNMELLLVRIFLYSDWIWRFTLQVSVFSPNAGQYAPEMTPYLDTFHAVAQLQRYLGLYQNYLFMYNFENGHTYFSNLALWIPQNF